jgi:hypothetical protein
MSVNNFLDAVPFSVSGLQNLQVNTINGGGFITTINIAGQIAFLSWNSTTETLTLFIPNASGVVTGLLTSTDWNTFNNKESPLTFSTPLTRGGIGGNTISFDFTQSLTFNGTTQTLNNNTIVAGNMYYTGATSATTGYILYIDNSTGFITKGVPPTAPSILGLDNYWFGNYNEYFSRMTIYNNNNDTNGLRVHRCQALYNLEYLYYNNDGKLGINNGNFNWNIDRNGEINAKKLNVIEVEASSNITTTGGFFIGNGLDIQTSYILLQSPLSLTNDFATLNWNSSTREVGWAPSLLGTTNTFAGNNTFNNNVNITIGGITHVVFNSAFQTTWYEPTGDIMSYLVKNGVTSLKWVVFRTSTSFAYYDTIANVVSTTSDARTKKNIRPIDIEKSKQFILSITPSIFQHKDGDITDTNIIGFIAQDILLNAKTEAQKNIVANWRPYEEAMAKQEEPKEILGVSSPLIIPELVGTIQLLNKQIDKLETDNKLLLERINAIKPTDTSVLQEKLEAMELKIKKLVNILGINI